MIVFNFVSYRNFLSAGDIPVKLLLDRSITTLITGKNGNGKSTPLDAITFALFGKSYRGVAKDKLVNTINKKDCETEVQLTIGKDVWNIQRGIKPNVLNITKNGVLLDTQATLGDQQSYIETYILGFNFKSFCQTCILGSSNFVPFMSMPAGQRREFIETLFGINVFSSMNSILKGKISEWKTGLDKLNASLEAEKTKYTMQQNFIDTLTNNKDTQIAKKKEALAILKQRASDLLGTIDNRTAYLKEKHSDIEFDTPESIKVILNDRLKSVQAEYDKSNIEIAKHKAVASQLHSSIEELKSLSHDSDCPTCMQSVNSNHVESCISKIKYELDNVRQQYTSAIEYAKIVKESIDMYGSLIENADNVIFEIKNAKQSLQNIKESASSIIEEINIISKSSTDAGSVDTEKNKLSVMKYYIEKLVEQKTEMLQYEEPYKVAIGLLKDTGIKSLIIKQYLPILNQRVNHYLSKMNFNVKFVLNEQFEESITTRNKTEFSYSNFSAGERQRIDLAMIFAWRDIASLKNSVNCNLLFLDEVGDSSLDSQGVDDLLTILDELKYSNVFVVSHRGNFEDKMRSVVRIEKLNGFSKIV